MLKKTQVFKLVLGHSACFDWSILMHCSMKRAGSVDDTVDDTVDEKLRSGKKEVMSREFQTLILRSKAFQATAFGVLLVLSSQGGQNLAYAKEAHSSYISDVARTLRNWGVYSPRSSSVSSQRSDVDALDAWSIQEGSRDIIVAVIDTGIDPTHKDLAKSLWHDPSRPNSESFGMNFVNPGKNPIDVHGHGTHVAGIIGGELDPELGTSGVAHHVSIMPLKYYSDGSSGVVNLNHTIEAINFAVDHGARVINYSGGGPEFSEREYQAIKRAEAKGIVFVAAAGNESQNIDEARNYYFPASYSNSDVNIYHQTSLSRPSNMIVVAATNSKNDLIAASNWGKSVDVAAPGENILSDLPNGRAGYMTGTSQATAFVSGAAALILSENPRLSPQEVRAILIQSSEPVSQLKGKVAAGGHLNVYEAVKLARTWMSPRGNILAQAQVTK